jgi:hypothetical protein
MRFNSSFEQLKVDLGVLLGRMRSNPILENVTDEFAEQRVIL